VIATPTGGSLGSTAVNSYNFGIGGNAGGSGGYINNTTQPTPGNNGGGTGNAPTATYSVSGGGGGGFGGSGAAGYSIQTFQLGAVGGYAINKNGKTVTVSGSGNIYGTQLP
jgi:hypothetical protein